MQIDRLDNNNLLFWRGQIEELINTSVKISFPNQNISDNYCVEKCNKLAYYLAEGTAIVFVAREEEVLLGWVWCHEVIRISAKRLHIAEIAVRDKYQRTGVGRQLMNEVEMYAKSKGYKEIDLMVTITNSRAIGFYENALFVPERYLMKKTIFPTVNSIAEGTENDNSILG